MVQKVVSGMQRSVQKNQLAECTIIFKLFTCIFFKTSYLQVVWMTGAKKVNFQGYCRSKKKLPRLLGRITLRYWAESRFDREKKERLAHAKGERRRLHSARAAHYSATAAAMRGLLSSSTLLRQAAGAAAAQLSRAGWSNATTSAPSPLRRFPHQVCPNISLPLHRVWACGLFPCAGDLFFFL